MGGLYNIVFGTNPSANVLLRLAGFTELPARFRDVWLEAQPEGPPLIHVYTRIGGGNRDDYQTEWDAYRAMPGFVREADDEFDSTYASLWFTPQLPDDLDPVERARVQVWMVERAGQPVDTSERWQDAIDALRGDGER